MALNRTMPRVQEILLPQLRTELTPLWPGLQCVSWIPDVDYRQFPIVQIRRLGGLTPPWMPPTSLDRPVIELTAYAKTSLEDTENLLMDAREVIFLMVRNQTVTDAGYLHSYFETLGPTQFDSPFEDSWRVQTLIQVGVRPPRS